MRKLTALSLLVALVVVVRTAAKPKISNREIERRIASTDRILDFTCISEKMTNIFNFAYQMSDYCCNQFLFRLHRSCKNSGYKGSSNNHWDDDERWHRGGARYNESVNPFRKTTRTPMGVTRGPSNEPTRGSTRNPPKETTREPIKVPIKPQPTTEAPRLPSEFEGPENRRAKRSSPMV